jgi:hypothetical protein
MRLAFAAAAAVLVAMSAFAQDDPEALNSQAEAAAKDGRLADAVSLSEQAWKSAESKWGDRRETGILALNLARLALAAGREAEAQAPAESVLALARKGALNGELTPAEAALFLGVAELAAGKDSGGRRLEKALAEQGRKPTRYDDVLSLAWIRSLEDAEKHGRWLDALNRAGQARLLLASLGDAHADDVYRVAMLEAQAALSQRGFYQASVAFGWAAYAYSIAHPNTAHVATNPEYARILVNESAVEAIVKTNTRSAPRLGTRIMEDQPPRMAEPGSVQELAPTWGRPKCYTWLDQLKPTYPPQGARRGLFGAVLVSYDIRRDGALENIRVAATAPDPMWPGFVNSITAAMAAWRALVPVNAPEACLHNQFTDFQFAFDVD